MINMNILELQHVGNIINYITERLQFSKIPRNFDRTVSFPLRISPITKQKTNVTELHLDTAY